jgi:hypothetical protein
MQKKPLIGISIVAVVLLVLASFTNVIGVQTIKSANQKVLKEEIDQKELLFELILDIVNNKEIQKIIQNSEIKGNMGRFFVPHMKLSLFTPHVLTKKFLNSAYNMGLILSKTISTSKIHSILEQYQMSHQGIQKEINAVIEKDAKLNGEITQLSNSKCDCENDNTIGWSFPVLCLLLYPLFIIALLLYVLDSDFSFFGTIIGIIGTALNCFWNILTY